VEKGGCDAQCRAGRADPWEWDAAFRRFKAVVHIPADGDKTGATGAAGSVQPLPGRQRAETTADAPAQRL